MDTCIETIETRGRGLKARRVVFDDGSERLTPAAAVKALGLEPGMRLSPDELESALAAWEPQLARDRALRLLGYRERSTRELERRLAEEGFPDDVVGDVIDSLRQSALLDDERFVEHLIRTRVSAGWGNRAILQQLLDHGIEREAAEALLKSLDEESPEADRLRTLLRERIPETSRDRERVLRKLVTKGFSPGAVLDALREGEASTAEQGFWDDS